MAVTLRDLRLKHRLTIRELGRRAGVNFSAIWRYEAAQRRPSWATEEKLASALKVSIRTVRQAIQNTEAARLPS